MPSFRSWIPHSLPVSLKERFRSSSGALIGIFATGLLSKIAVGENTVLPVLIAPMGASAVLLFAVPSSPLAQPWSIVGGNAIAALAGVSAAMTCGNPFVASALAVGVAIALMMTCRCVHPPSGAVALTAVLGGQTIHDLGYSYVLWPVGANTMLLLGVAFHFNNLTGRPYPHGSVGISGERAMAELPGALPIGFSSADLDAVLVEYDQLLDIDRTDLEDILRQAELRSYRRRAGQTTCATIMSRHVTAISPHAPIGEAFDLLSAQRVKALPVTDESARVLGLVTHTDLLDKAAWDGRGPRLGLGRRMRLSLTRGRAPSGSVEDIMTTPVELMTPETPLADVVRVMARMDLHHLPVVDARGKLAGIVSQADLIVALLAEAARTRSPEALNL